MKRIAVLFSLLLALTVPASAQLTMTGVGGGFGVAAGGAYTGPGDLTLTGTTIAWGGFSCWKASAPTAPAVRLINETTTTQADINCDTTNGIDLTAVASLGCGSAVCKVVTVYDQTGFNNCSGATACLVSQTTDANRPTYTATGGAGSKPCATWASGNTLNSAPLTSSLAQPFSLATVSKRTGTGYQGVLTFSTSLVGYYWSATANNVALYGGSFTADVAATDASFHSLTGVENGASSIIGVDGTSTTGLSAGTNATGAGNFIIFGDTTNIYTGTACEFWVVSGGWTTGNITSISSNAHTRYGF